MSYRYCNKCMLLSTRPFLKFNEEGTCYPCLSAETRKDVDWEARWKELDEVGKKYKGCNGDNYYDCIVTVSGGKDSHYQLHLVKEVLGMHPLCVMVDNCSWTDTGRHNLDNMLKEFEVDLVRWTINPEVVRKLIRMGFEKNCNPSMFFERAIHVYPLIIASKLGIPLIFYGENTSYMLGGPYVEDSPDATLLRSKDYNTIPELEEWAREAGLDMKDLNMFIYPPDEELDKITVKWLGYYVPWNPYQNMEWARTRGFKTLDDTGEWERIGYIDQYDQIDTNGDYMMDTYCTFGKFGYAGVTDTINVWIRDCLVSRNEAAKLVLEHDWKLDPKILKDFLDFTGYTEEEFWEIYDRFINHDIIEKRDGNWRLKPNVEEALIKGTEVET